MRHYSLGTICAAIVPAALFLSVAASTPAAQTGTVDSPHGRSDQCVACHDADPKRDAFRADKTCVGCHEGEEPHVVDVVPQEHLPPNTWPLADGRLSCMTCHDEPACDGQPIQAQNPAFLRAGPYPKPARFCASCHSAGAIDQINPHTAMFSAGSVDRSACAYCHDDDGSGRMECKPCHEGSPHVSSTDHGRQASAAAMERVAASGLPLHDGRVDCVTCHDPHPAGVIPERAPTNAGVIAPEPVLDALLRPFFGERRDALGREPAPPKGRDALLRMDMVNSELCRACHQSGGRQ